MRKPWFGAFSVLVLGTLFLFMVMGCSVDPNVAVSVTGVALDRSTVSLSIGGTSQLTATITPVDSTNTACSWASSDSSVASVSSGGLVSGLAVGSATITVTTVDGGKTATCSVTVTDASVVAVSGVSLSMNSLTIGLGGTEELIAIVAPADATNKAVTWSSDAASIAKVSSAGLVTGVAKGSATITATTADGAKTAICAVTVTDPIAVSGVSLDKLSLSVGVGTTGQLKAIFTPTNATNKAVTWSSGNTAVATVSSAGLITGLALGDAIITVTTVDGNKTAACSVSVKATTITITVQ